MFEMKLNAILKVLLLNSSHVKVDPNKHCQIKNYNKLTTIEGSKFVYVMATISWVLKLVVNYNRRI